MGARFSNTRLDLNKLFYMFPGSEIAQKFRLGKTKCAYLVNCVVRFKIIIYVLPFVKDQLIKNIVA